MGARLRTAVVATCFVALMLAAPSAHAAFPGTDGKIAFSRDGNIWTVNPDASNPNPTQLTATGYDFEPAWSPDGSKIAFVSERDGNYEIYVMDSSGARQTRVTNDPDRDNFPAWSPDGKRIAFSHYALASIGADIYVVNADGTGLRNLTNTPDQTEYFPAWSPGGTKIAFSAGGDIFVMNVDGTGRTQLTNYTSEGASDPNWSPDNQKIAYGHSFGSSHDFRFAINVMNADGSGDTAIVCCDSVDPAFSPTGHDIVFWDNYGGGILLIAADGSGQVTQVPGTIYQDVQPDWQPIPANRPPDCSGVAATPGTLWPSNGKLVSVSVAAASDPDGDQVTLTITGVTQDEPTRRSPDAKLGPASNQVKLRAKRSNHGDGRVYRIAFKATDGRGGECSGTATAGIPRRKNRPAVDSAPPSYDSLVGTPAGGAQDGAR